LGVCKSALSFKGNLKRQCELLDRKFDAMTEELAKDFLAAFLRDIEGLMPKG
jgi:hypothetical protein